jgi:glycosyltransferase involved in cell wall biosynthesis
VPNADHIDLTSRTDKPTVIHVAESFASGTASAVLDYVRNFPAADHHLVYALCDDAKIDLRQIDCFASMTKLPDGTLARLRFLRRHLHEYQGDVFVHAHSSWAGMYVRTAVRKTRARRLLYTPHCYAFERSDVGWLVRGAFRAVEWLLSFNTTAFGACSPREAALSQWAMSSARVVTVPNVQPTGLTQRSPGSASRPLRVVCNGRLGPQKDPQFFARALAAAASAVPGTTGVWVGGGDARYVDMLQRSGVEVTGWLPRQEALEVMASCDLYLHTAAWEGFPIAILEAAGMGLPVVSRQRPYVEGVRLPMVIDEPEDFARTVTGLREDGGLDRLQWLIADALADHTHTRQRAALRDLYEPAA